MTTTTDAPLTAYDFLAVDNSLSDEELLVRDTVRAFVSRDLLDRLSDAYAAGHLPTGFPTAAGQLGLLGMHLHGYGCPGMSAVSYGLACMELEAGDSGLRSFVSVQGSLAMFAIFRYGSEQQKQTWLPPMAQGTAIGCFGLTEPDAGSDPSGMRTTARLEDGQWVLNGAKMWITNGDIADVAVVRAKTPDGVRGFVVPRNTRFRHARNPEQALAAGVDHLRAGLRRLPAAGRCHAARGDRSSSATVVPDRGPIRHRLGRGRSCAGLL
jgi:glutaryl-CoA dehydrogenase